MKPLLVSIGLSVAIFFVGCASTGEVLLDSTKRNPTTSVEIFKEGSHPTRPFKPIAELSFLGPPKEELRAQNHFIGRAKQLGANAIVFTAEDTGERSGFPAYQTPVILYSCEVLVYE